MTTHSNITRIKAVLSKDLQSEFRTRYGISAIGLFILTSITILVFAVGLETLNSGILAGLLWIIMFFGSMTGLSKSFVSEEERQTSLLLKTATKPGAVYSGKLLFNILFSISMNIFSVLLFMIFFTIEIKSVSAFMLIILLGSLGLGSASTIISAIISKAGVKNTLFTVLSFPVLLPLIIVGIQSTTAAFDGKSFGEIASSLQILLAYSGALIPVSYILFDLIWEE